MGRARRTPARVAVEFPVRRGELSGLLALWPALPAVAHAPSAGARWLGLGVASAVRAAGLRPARVRAWAERHLADLDARETDRFEPRVLGGLAFSRASVGVEPWAGFPGVAFLLPRWTYVEEGRRSRLIFIGEARELATAAVERTALVAALERPLAANPSATGQQVESQAQFGRLVVAAREEVRQGRVEKLVVARAARFSADTPWSAAATLRALLRVPGCTAFAVRLGGQTFLGATPERLALRRGAELWTEALAGTAAVGAEAQLRRSDKDLGEHQVVVREIARRLAPLCLSLSVARRPVIRKVSEVLHLLTPITGQLRGSAHLLDLVQRLHPTPAVGGRPKRRAQRWIVARERTPRGWYAGCVGWFDRTGDGEMSVAIRSGLLRRRAAWVFAGAGIVGASDPVAEYRETEAKLGTMRRALGIGERP